MVSEDFQKQWPIGTRVRVNLNPMDQNYKSFLTRYYDKDKIYIVVGWQTSDTDRLQLSGVPDKIIRPEWVIKVDPFAVGDKVVLTEEISDHCGNSSESWVGSVGTVTRYDADRLDVQWTHRVGGAVDRASYERTAGWPVKCFRLVSDRNLSNDIYRILLNNRQDILATREQILEYLNRNYNLKDNNGV